MNLCEHNVLFLSRTMEVGGTEKVMIQMCEALQPYVKNIVVCSCGGVNEKKLATMGIKHYLIPDMEKKNPAVVYKILRKLKEIIDTEKITIIHAHHRMAAFYTAIVSCMRPFCFFATAHNIFEDKKYLTRMAYKNAKVIACGESVKDNLCEYYKIPNKHVTVIHNAMDRFEGLNAINSLLQLKEQGYWLVGNVGRLSKQKGMEYFIQSFLELGDVKDKVKFIIVGDGEDKQKLEDLTKYYNIVEDVLFMGYREDVQNVIKHLDVVVLSSLWEGFPLLPMEAFSVNKTIIATKISGTTDIVKDGINGCLVEAKSPQQIAEKIEYLLINSEKRQKLEQEAYRTYINEYTLDKFNERIVAFYKDVE